MGNPVKEQPKFDFKEFEKVIKTMVGIWIGCTIVLIIAVVIGGSGKTGPIGDTFGIINSLFSCLAFGALWYSIRLQKEELSDTRAEFAKQSESLEEQSKSMIAQRFDNTFFNIIESLDIMIDDMKWRTQNGAGKGLDTFMHVLLVYEAKIEQQRIDPGDHDSRRKYFKEVIRPISYASMRPYINSVHVLLRAIDEYNQSDEQRNFYLSIFGATFNRRQYQFFELYSHYWGIDDDRNNRLKKFLTIVAPLVDTEPQSDMETI